MDKKTLLGRNERRISLTLLAAVLLLWAAVFLMENPPPIGIPLHPPLQPDAIISGSDSNMPPGEITLDLSQSFEGCCIEYGLSECIDGYLVTPFYNSGDRILTRVSMHFYDGEDADIYNCREPLMPSITETLTTIPCNNDIDTSEVMLEWCCGEECSEAYMDEPSGDLSLVRGP
jgi:hypothetical protein